MQKNEAMYLARYLNCNCVSFEKLDNYDLAAVEKIANVIQDGISSYESMSEVFGGAFIEKFNPTKTREYCTDFADCLKCPLYKKGSCMIQRQFLIDYPEYWTDEDVGRMEKK